MTNNNYEKILKQGLDYVTKKNFQEAKKFFRPSKDDFIDPFLMLNMNKAVDRIILSIERNEKVLVYGDYDVDGTCSVTLM